VVLIHIRPRHTDDVENLIRPPRQHNTHANTRPRKELSDDHTLSPGRMAPQAGNESATPLFTPALYIGNLARHPVRSGVYGASSNRSPAANISICIPIFL
ncbi:hypothetical protein, partial [Streptomyces decoyicus]